MQDIPGLLIPGSADRDRWTVEIGTNDLYWNVTDRWFRNSMKFSFLIGWLIHANRKDDKGKKN